MKSVSRPPNPQHGLFPQLLHLGPALERSGALLHDGLSAVPVVRHIRAAGLCRLLLWLPQAGVPAPGAHQHDPATGAAAAVVHELGPVHPDGGHPALWRRLHRTILRVLGHLAEPVLLPVRLPVPRLLHPRGQLWPDRHRDDVLPAVRRGLPVVVAQLHRVGRVGRLHPVLRRLLLLHEARDNRVHSDAALPGLHGHHGAHLLAAHRHNRLLCRLQLHTQDLQRSQDRLNMNLLVYLYFLSIKL